MCDREAHPRFFLDWYWRIVARLGLSRAWLARGETATAAAEADRALEAALATADSALKALAWEVKARIAQSAQDWQRAGQCLEKAFDALASREVPFAAWQVQAAAADLHRATGNQRAAKQNLMCAAATLRRLADSFADEEAMRETLLATAAAQQASLQAGE